jgi:hypothetical protein
MVDLPNAPSLGERSELTQWAGSWSDLAVPYRALDLSFQHGNLYGGVLLYDYSGADPAVATVESLARTFVTRIETVLTQPGPGLSNRVLRLTGTSDQTQNLDAYVRLGGEGYPIANDPTSASFQAAMPSATDIYAVDYSVPGVGGFAARVARYPTVEDATRIAQDWSRSQWGPLPGTLSAVHLIVGAPVFGDESVTFGFLNAANPTVGAQPNPGRGILVRVGREIALIMIEAPGDIPPATVEALAAAQTACLVGGACPSIPIAVAWPDAAGSATPTA